MTRKECYDYIVKNNLKEEVKQKFNLPYSSVPTTLLEDFIGLDGACQYEKHCAAAANVEAWDRNQCFDVIKSHGWQDEIKDEYCRPYNSVSTDSLKKFIAFKLNGPVAVKKEDLKGEAVDNFDKISSTTTKECIDEKARKVLVGLCTVLNLEGLLNNLK